jgi:hypothetical protein
MGSGQQPKKQKTKRATGSPHNLLKHMFSFIFFSVTICLTFFSTFGWCTIADLIEAANNGATRIDLAGVTFASESDAELLASALSKSVATIYFYLRS